MTANYLLLLIIFVTLTNGIYADTKKTKMATIKVRSNDNLKKSSKDFSSWTPWSTCKNCWQNRIKICISTKCKNSRLYEERPCDRKRCHRQRHMKSIDKRLHILKQIKIEDVSSTKQLKPNIWSKWSKWKECSSECQTERYKVCRNPKKCKRKRRSEKAYCYLKESNCEVFVLQLLHSMNINKQKFEDISQYEYHTTKKPTEIKIRRNCGRIVDRSMLKILGGKKAEKNKWPWHVAILNKYSEVFCSGTLIAPRWVLTANHCLRPYLKVRLNEYDVMRYDPREIETIVKSFSHPNFNHSTVDNDIALLRLPKPVNLPVACLPRHKPRVADTCSIMGWGKMTTSDVAGSRFLHEAEIPIVNNLTCINAYRQYLITKNMFCAGYYSGRVDTCAGDSGGGLMCKERGTNRYFVQGITSFGDGCGVKNKYGIYTNVMNYKRWIHDTMRKYQ